ncbi:MAG: 50S ribosomal protein L24 [Chloroflexi bacterium]|nr:MAG: 50S ribosomal protein L24 [Chloroflexota bacterium]
MKVKIRKGDTVEVISGKEIDKGKRGEVIKVLPEEHRIVISGVNIRKKHQRQVQAQGRTLKPGIIEFEAPLDISNVMFVCPKCDEPTRLGIRREDGEVQRVCKNCGAEFD